MKIGDILTQTDQKIPEELSNLSKILGPENPIKRAYVWITREDETEKGLFRAPHLREATRDESKKLGLRMVEDTVSKEVIYGKSRAYSFGCILLTETGDNGSFLKKDIGAAPLELENAIQGNPNAQKPMPERFEKEIFNQAALRMDFLKEQGIEVHLIEDMYNVKQVESVEAANELVSKKKTQKLDDPMIDSFRNKDSLQEMLYLDAISPANIIYSRQRR